MSKLSKEMKAEKKAFLKSVKGLKKAEFDAADISAVYNANDEQSLISALQYIANHTKDDKRSQSVQAAAEKSLHALGQPTSADLTKYQQLREKMEAPITPNDQQSIAEEKETVLSLADTLVQLNFMKQKFPTIDSQAKQPALQAEQPAPQAAKPPRPAGPPPGWKPPRPAGPPPGQATAAEQTVSVSQPKLKTTSNNSHSVIIGDIFTQLVNPSQKDQWPIIVDPAHEKTMNGNGGMSGAIKAFYEKSGKKKEYIRDLLKFPKENGLRCPNGQVRRTSTDGIEILHTSAPDLRSKRNVNKDGTPTEDAQQKLYQAYYNTFKSAAELNQQNSSQRALSCPILGAGIFKWPMELSTEIAGKALQQFRQDYGNDLQVNFYVHPSALKAGQTPEELETNLSRSIQEGIDDTNLDKAYNAKHIGQRNTTNDSTILEEKLKDKTLIRDLVTKLNSLKDSYDIYKPLAKGLQSLLEQGLSESDMAKEAVELVEQTFDKIANYNEREFPNPAASKARMKNVIISSIDLLYDEKLNADKTKEQKVRFAEETPAPAESEPKIDAPVPPKRSGRPLPAIPAAASETVKAAPASIAPATPSRTNVSNEFDALIADMNNDLQTQKIQIFSAKLNQQPSPTASASPAQELDHSVKISSQDHKDSVRILVDISDDLIDDIMKGLSDNDVDKMQERVKFLRTLNDEIRSFGQGNRTLGDVLKIVENSGLVADKNANPLQVLTDGIESIAKEYGLTTKYKQLIEIHDIVKTELSEPLNIPFSEKPITLSASAPKSAQQTNGPVQTQSTPSALDVNIQALYNIERENTHKEKSLFHSFARNVVNEMGKLKANSARENQITGLQALVDNYNKAPSNNRENEAFQLYTALEYVKYEIGRESNKFSSSLAIVCDKVLNKIPKQEREAVETSLKKVSPSNITGAINTAGEAAIKQSATKPSESSSNKQKR